jgi:hypothetical protein
MAQYVRNTLQGAGLTDKRVPSAPIGGFWDPARGNSQYQSPLALQRESGYSQQIQNIVGVDKARTLRTNALADFAAREAARQAALAQQRALQQSLSGIGSGLAGQPFSGGRGSSIGGGRNISPGSAGKMGYSALGQQIAASVGWTGSQWNAFYKLGVNESGWNPNAQNPTSSAYGIGQFLDSTWGSVGGRKTSDPSAQIRYMIKYIQQRYGTPQAALNAWYSRSPHWY